MSFDLVAGNERKMDREEARARMLRLWAAMGDAGGAPVSILTTQQYVRPRARLLLVLVGS